MWEDDRWGDYVIVWLRHKMVYCCYDNPPHQLLDASSLWAHGSFSCITMTNTV